MEGCESWTQKCLLVLSGLMLHTASRWSASGTAWRKKHIALKISLWGQWHSFLSHNPWTMLKSYYAALLLWLSVKQWAMTALESPSYVFKLGWALFVTYTIIQSIMSSEMCSLHLTHPSVHTWSSGQPTVQRPGSSRGLPVGAGISERCKKYLKARIAEESVVIPDVEGEDLEKAEQTQWAGDQTQTDLRQWVTEICEESRSLAVANGDHDNMHFLPEIIPSIIWLASYLPLWTGVMIPHFRSTNIIASSANVEADVRYIGRNSTLQVTRRGGQLKNQQPFKSPSSASAQKRAFSSCCGTKERSENASQRHSFISWLSKHPQRNIWILMCTLSLICLWNMNIKLGKRGLISNHTLSWNV